MQTILNNPYRILGVLANSSTRDLQNRKGKIQAFSRVGKEITSEYDFPFFSSLQRDNTTIDKAFSNIEQNQNKVTHSLFWFINLNSIDNTAIQHLINGNKEKAIEIWENLTDEKEVDVKNFSAFNNIGTLYLLEKSKEKIQQGITAKIKLIESENFKDFVHTVADETFSIDKNKQIELLIDDLLAQFKNKFSTAEIIDLFSSCTGTTQKYLSKKFTEEPVHKIEKQIEKAKNRRIKDKSNANRFAFDLYKETKSELKLIKSILGYKNLQYKMLADNVAKELLQCSIDYFNESQEQGKSIDYLEEALGAARIAEDIAIYNGTTKKKIQENIKTLEGMKDRELIQAIDVLKSIKDTYEKNELKIRQQVKVQEANLEWGKKINWSEVNNKIKNSINWWKAVKLIQEIIPQKNINKIKKVKNENKIKEYKNLVNFFLDKLNHSNYEEVKYLRYWKSDSKEKLGKILHLICFLIVIIIVIVCLVMGVSWVTIPIGMILLYLCAKVSEGIDNILNK